MKSLFILFGIILISLSVKSQTLYVPDGEIGTSSSSNVGIGTSNPQSTLSLGRNTANRFALYEDDFGTSAGKFFYGLGIAIPSPGIYGLALYGGTGPEFPTNTNMHIFIRSNGNVGIGTGTPSAKLEVVGDGGITSFTGTNHLGLLVRGSNNSGTDLSGIDFSGYSSVNYMNPLARIAVKPTSAGSYLLFGTSNLYSNGITNTAMAIDYNGKVGIGTTNPNALLEVYNTVNPNFRITAASNKYMEFGVATGNDNYAIGAIAGDGVIRTLGGRNSLIFSIPNNVKDGNSFIGFEDNGNGIWLKIFNNKTLRMDGLLYAKEIKVQTNVWADFVFAPNYKLRPLSEVEQFIKTNQHLPEIPKAEEVQKDGVNLGEMQTKLLQKVEELTLYLIELKKDNDQMKKDNEIMKKEIEALKKK